MKRALVTGAAGQTGSYMVDFLLKRDYHVFAHVRSHRAAESENLRHAIALHDAGQGRLTLLHSDLGAPGAADELVTKSQPHEVYHFAAESHVGLSFQFPARAMASAMHALSLLEAIRRLCRDAKFYQASTSEMFGDNIDAETQMQSLDTPFAPNSPYGVGKLAAHRLSEIYAKAWGMRTYRGISFNHESPRRHPAFVTRKITKTIAEAMLEPEGRSVTLHLGNLDAKRDWSHAEDIAWGAYLLLQQELVTDVVFATGVTTSVREFLALAKAHAGGEAIENLLVRTDPSELRPYEVPELRGEASSARVLGWTPTRDLRAIVEEMLEADVARLCRKHGRGLLSATWDSRIEKLLTDYS